MCKLCFKECSFHKKWKVKDLGQKTPSINSQMFMCVCLVHYNNSHYLNYYKIIMINYTHSTCQISMLPAEKEHAFLSFTPVTKGFQEWLVFFKYYRNHLGVTHQPLSGSSGFLFCGGGQQSAERAFPSITSNCLTAWFLPSQSNAGLERNRRGWGSNLYISGLWKHTWEDRFTAGQFTSMVIIKNSNLQGNFLR